MTRSDEPRAARPNRRPPRPATPSGRGGAASRRGGPGTERSEKDAPPPPVDTFERPWVLLRSATLHPFVYRKMVREVDTSARPGDVVSVYDRHGALYARGLYNPHSQIVVRLLGFGPAPIDAEFWRQRLSAAVQLRRDLRIDEQTDAYRLVHAEGDGVSGLVVERFADCLVCEVFSLGIHQRLPIIVPELAGLLGQPGSLDRPGRSMPAWRAFARADARSEALEGFSCRGVRRVATSPGEIASEETVESPPNLVIREHGVRYRVDIGAQKTGFFCDQRENRRRFAALCRDADVLDVCCYTGGFGLCAKLLGGARAVTAVDLDEAALGVARENVNLNQTRIDLAHADAFIYLRQMIAISRTFDAVVLDPPKLALSRADYDEAMRKYHDLNVLALQVVRPGGFLVTCSCSGLVSAAAFVECVLRAAKRVGRVVQMIDLTGAGPDHPVMLSCPESSYLKAAWLRVG
ncbi:MAG: Ribosomal RNA large subunit methyltransferase I [Phycisphaerae bacterium]|nr:Ribosomal RNA large subunit methyltransferase I [Phycisphaerae bacterium]